MEWSVTGTSYPVEFFGSFEAEEILYYFDGPRLFTFLGRDGDLLLAYQCDEDATVSRFVVVACDAGLVDAVTTGRCSIRNALTQRWTWVVDQPHGQPLQAAWRAQLSSVPQELLPGESVMLAPTMAPLPSQNIAPAAAQRRRGALREFPALTI